MARQIVFGWFCYCKLWIKIDRVYIGYLNAEINLSAHPVVAWKYIVVKLKQPVGYIYKALHLVDIWVYTVFSLQILLFHQCVQVLIDSEKDSFLPETLEFYLSLFHL